MKPLRKNEPIYIKKAIKLYQVDGYSLGQISEVVGVSRQALWDSLRRRIELRPQLRFGDENHFYRGGSKSSDYAQNVLEKAVCYGRVERKTKCEDCGDSGKFRDGRSKIQAHHDDYNKPLDVRWLCQKCHHLWHKENQAVIRNSQSRRGKKSKDSQE